MFKPENLLFTKEHEWAAVEGKIATIGITDFAQNSLGDVVYVQLPNLKEEVEINKSFGTIESIKAVSNLYSPLSGTITEVNEALVEKPELVNSEPYGGGWIFKIKISKEEELKQLMNYTSYQNFTSES